MTRVRATETFFKDFHAMGPADPFLVVQKTGDAPIEIALAQEKPSSIGRSSGNEIVLRDRAVSRRHAQIAYIDESFWVQDCDSTNGTLLNGQRLRERARLSPGDRLEIGPFLLVLSPKHHESNARLSDGGSPMTLHSISLEEFIDSQARTVPSDEQETAPEHMLQFLQSIDRVGQALLAHRSINDLFRIVVDLTAEVLKPDRTVLLLREPGRKDLLPKATKERGGGKGDEILISRSIAWQAIEERQAILSADASTDERFREKASVANLQIHSAMCAPLWNDADVIGLLYVDNLAAPMPFSQNDLRLLTLIGHLAAVKIRETEAHEKLQERRQLEEELKYAADIQEQLLPSDTLERKPYRIAGLNVPTFEVGGDYFDIFEDSNGIVWVGLGDVSGKGMSAALLMSCLHAGLRAQVDANLPLKEVIPRLNQAIRRNTLGERFITLVLVTLDVEKDLIHYVNAGHNRPILLRASGEVELLGVGGLLLGVFAQAEYEIGSVQMGSGDLLLVYSDGVTEARDDKDEEFGEERLLEFLRSNRSLPPEAFVEKLIHTVQNFSVNGDPDDDVTGLLIKRE